MTIAASAAPVLAVARPSSAVAVGIGLAAVAFFMFTGMDAMVKWLTGRYPLHQVVFFNSLFSLIPVALMTARAGGLGRLRTRRPGLHLLRGLFALLSTLGGFYAYSRMPLADAYAIIFIGPLLITALSVPLLGEPVGWRRWAAVGVGFVGVLIMLRPGTGVMGAGAVGALACAASYALSVITLRKLSGTETTASVALYGNLTIMVGTGVLLAFHFEPLTPHDLLLSAACGLTGGTAFILMVNAYRRVPPVVVAPFQYTQMAWGVLLGFLIWGDVPQAAVLFGCSIVVASGLFILYRETARGAGPVGLPRRPDGASA